MLVKSPFYVIDSLISPLMCEEIIDLCGFGSAPNMQLDDRPRLTIRTSPDLDEQVFTALQPRLPSISAYYGIVYKGTERMKYEWYPEGCPDGAFIAENAERIGKKWMRTRANDLTGILFLTDYQDQAPIDPEFEAYGGKLEFVQHQFSFNPRRGTAVVFPSDPHFINATSAVVIGDAYQVRFHIVAKEPYLYNPADFPGNYTNWFKE